MAAVAALALRNPIVLLQRVCTLPRSYQGAGRQCLHLLL